MSDAMQVAKQRHKDYQTSVKAKEAEIEELNELIADLESFMEFGEALMGKETEPSKRAVVSRPVVQVNKQMVDPENEWAKEEDDDEDSDGISRVLSQRTG